MNPEKTKWPLPVIGFPPTREGHQPLAALGRSIVIHEWKGSGPPWMHVHYEDDEGWHILEGTLHFSFPDKTLAATPGMTVFVPAGLPHTYRADPGSRYLVILTPRLDQLITALQTSDPGRHKDIMKKFKSDIIEGSGGLPKP
jgi:hypothetical protein